MKKEKVFIVVTHRHSLKKRSKTEWEVSEFVEFVNQLRNRHISNASAIGDYINKTMITGKRVGMGDYEKFEEYIRSKYTKQMLELDAVYRQDQIVDNSITEVVDTIVDTFGNTRERTVFDV